MNTLLPGNINFLVVGWLMPRQCAILLLRAWTTRDPDDVQLLAHYTHTMFHQYAALRIWAMQVMKFGVVAHNYREKYK